MTHYVTLISTIGHSNEGKIGLFFVMMFISFVADIATGWLSSIVTRLPCSSIGIVGLLKHSCIFLVLFMLTFFCLILGTDTLPFLYIFYISYILTEFQSILENMDKAGIDVKLFKWLIQSVSENKGINDNDKTIKK